MRRFDTDMVSVEDEKLRADRTVRQLKQEQDGLDNPTTMDYIKLKHEVADLEKQVSSIL